MMHIKNLLSWIAVIMIILTLNNCKHSPLDVNEPVGPTGPTGTTGPTGPTGNLQPCEPGVVYFSRDVLPILTSSCAVPGCHDANTAEDDVILTDYNSVMQTADVRPGNPGNSDLYEVLIETDPDKKMPPPSSGITLTNEQVNTIYQWILQGAQNLFCDDSTGCDTLNMSFANDIFPIIQTHCLGCHSGTSPQGNVNLDGYNNVIVYVNNGRLLGALKGLPGYVPMPYNQPPLDNCLISKIENWINEGAQNN